jgi:diguanylate cyclase (GGDEF)-like protein
VTAELVLRGEFDVLHPLAVRVHQHAMRGVPTEALRMADESLLVARAGATPETVRYLVFTRGRILSELGRASESADCAEELLELSADDAHPYWRAKALGLQAIAAATGNEVTRAVDLLGEAWVQIGSGKGRYYNQTSAAAIVGHALAGAELYEHCDELLRRVHRTVEGSLAPEVVIDALRFLGEWGVRLLVIGRDEEAGRRFADLASRAALMRRLLGSPTHRYSVFVDLAEAFAWSGLGHGAEAIPVLDRLLRSGAIDKQRVEWMMLVTGYAYALMAEARWDEAEDLIEQVRAQAKVMRREIWVTAADGMLIRLDLMRSPVTLPVVERSTTMFRRAAAQLWTERQERFAAVRRQMRIQELIAQSAQATVLTRLDPLTGVGNRRALQSLLDTVQGPISAVFIDVDHFKSVNDQHSHVVGDAVLVRLARLLSRQVRDGDLLARFGGDEFVVVLPRERVEAPGLPSTVLAAQLVAERILAEVRAEDWSQVSPDLGITVSVGVARVEDPRDVLAVASRALKGAKTSGRDRMAVAEPV